MSMNKIGVLGAGVMGIGVAQCGALAADHVVLIDTQTANFKCCSTIGTTSGCPPLVTTT